MLPAALLAYRTAGDRIAPAFLGDADHPWLRALLEERDRFVGRRRRELRARLQEPLSIASPPRKRALAAHVLEGLAPARAAPGLSPRRARAELFTAAADGSLPRHVLVEDTARRFGITARELEDALLADLPGERLVPPLSRSPSPLELAARANLALCRGLLARASRVTIEIEGGALPVVRHAKLRGLIVSVARAGGGAAVLEMSGPLALFHHTRVYGRALGEVVPLLAWSRRFRLEARCVLAEGTRILQLATGDPIFPAEEPRAYDSRLEEQFARDFRRAAPEWDVGRDPVPVAAGAGLVFPDFALTHREVPSRRWLVEVVGFWTPEYLERKLAAYRAANLSALVLCIDERRRCQGGELPPGARVVWYRRRIDPRAVLTAIAADAVGPLCAEEPPKTGGDPEALLRAIRAIASQSPYGNAFVPLVERRLGRRVVLADLVALCRSGHVALNRPTRDFAVRPLSPLRPPFATTAEAVRERIAEAIEAARRGPSSPWYHLVRERFDWLGPGEEDRLRPLVEDLAREGVVLLCEHRGRATIEIGPARRKPSVSSEDTPLPP